MTPNDTEVLIHWHVDANKHQHYDAPAVMPTVMKSIDVFLAAGLIYEVDEHGRVIDISTGE